MNENILFQIRLTGILLENDQILIVKQKVDSLRNWSLPGGRLERGETIEEGIKREMKEETGLETEIIRLLYLCDKTDADPPLIHITFLLKRIGGQIRMPTNEYDKNPIADVKMVSIGELTDFGFSNKFKEIVGNELPESGTYMRSKWNIGI